ncbi:hypothetical protein [Aliagarivorans marinus]|uniref:hypothetical protein n=1 Tax=Aliagarivorans marinus TaxID=561965 RepID=UPI000478EF08|nr:hypothetical protein [Aliagarivorans marinus]
MKKTVLALGLFSVVLGAQASLFEVELEGSWANTSGSSSDWQGDASLRFWHALPIIPNVAAGMTKRDQGNVFDGSSYNLELFYRLFDAANLRVDWGLAYENWSADHKWLAGTDGGEQLAATARVNWRLPFMNFGVMADALYPLHDEKYQREQYRAGLSYRFTEFPEFRVTGGYQWEDMKAPLHRESYSGPFVGINFLF